MLYAIQSHGHVVGVGVIAVKLPGQVMPLKGCRRRTCNSCGPPRVAQRIPNVPLAIRDDAALSPENELLVTDGLVHVEFQSLRNLGAGQVEVEVILEMG